MDDTLSMVADFHRVFGIPVKERPTLAAEREPELQGVVEKFAMRMRQLGNELHGAAARYNGDVTLLRLQLCQEELGELATALAEGDVVEALDALCDMRYVADGTVLAMGLQHIFMSAFREVQRSNMSKLDEHGRPIRNEAGRVVKGPGYSRPDIGKFVS